MWFTQRHCWDKRYRNKQLETRLSTEQKLSTYGWVTMLCMINDKRILTKKQTQIAAKNNIKRPTLQKLTTEWKDEPTCWTFQNKQDSIQLLKIGNKCDFKQHTIIQPSPQQPFKNDNQKYPKQSNITEFPISFFCLTKTGSWLQFNK